MTALDLQRYIAPATGDGDCHRGQNRPPSSSHWARSSTGRGTIYHSTNTCFNTAAKMATVLKTAGRALATSSKLTAPPARGGISNVLRRGSLLGHASAAAERRLRCISAETGATAGALEQLDLLDFVVKRPVLARIWSLPHSHAHAVMSTARSTQTPSPSPPRPACQSPPWTSASASSQRLTGTRMQTGVWASLWAAPCVCRPESCRCRDGPPCQCWTNGTPGMLAVVWVWVCLARPAGR
jgi:hypothetical protein